MVLLQVRGRNVFVFRLRVQAKPSGFRILSVFYLHIGFLQLPLQLFLLRPKAAIAMTGAVMPPEALCNIQHSDNNNIHWRWAALR